MAPAGRKDSCPRRRGPGIGLLALCLLWLGACTTDGPGPSPDAGDASPLDASPIPDGNGIADAAVDADGVAPPAPGCRSVAVGGGGYVTGIYAHPTTPDLLYLRTDVGGFYRWDPVNEAWTPLNDAFRYDEKQSQRGLGLALDPADPDLVYIAGGWGAGGKLYKSTDRGASWTAVHTLYIEGNAEHRWTGERLAVDPADPDVVLFGSQQDGLQRGTSGGTSWSVAAGIPPGDPPFGVNAVAFDPTLPGHAYAASRGNGVYESVDHGDTFDLLSGSPDDVNRLVVAGDGTVYVTRSGGVSRFATGAWTTLSPSSPNGFNALAVDPMDPQHVLIAEHGQWITTLYRTEDGGDGWSPLTVERVSTVPWWPDAFFANWSASLLFDPCAPGRVWQTDWFGVWRTEDIRAATTTWTAFEQGHEEVVTHDLLSLPTGYELISGVADVGGFLHASVNDYPQESLGKSDGTYVHDNYSLAADPADPLRVARVGGSREDPESWGYISSDGGNTWRPMTGAPAGRIARRIVHSATGGTSLLIVDDEGQPYLNADGTGDGWVALAGLPLQGPYGPWVSAVRATADGAKPDTFYYVLETTLYASEAGGAFTPEATSLPESTSSSIWDYVTLIATPGTTEDLWLGIEKVGLVHLTGAAFTATDVGGFSSVFSLSAGKPGPDAATPTFFVTGVRAGAPGLFWSTDGGATFIDVTDPAHQVILRGKLEASRQTHGRVFLGFGGRGIFVCDVVTD